MSNAFWVEFSIADGLDAEEVDKVMDDHMDFIVDRNCTSHGAPCEKLAWKELVYNADGKDITEEDREAVIEYLSSPEMITEYRVGDFVMYEDAEEDAIKMLKESIIRYFTSEESEE